MTGSVSVRFIEPLLNLPIARRTRRNHGLEHATIHVLSKRVAGLQMAGRSDGRGFVLLGEVQTAAVVRAVDDALSRMRGGDHQLAIHPNCGTNLVTTAYLTSIVALLGTRGATRRTEDLFNRLPIIMMGMILALIISQPLGTWLQCHITTDGDPADMQILDINRSEVNWFGSKMVIHRVNTRSS